MVEFLSNTMTIHNGERILEPNNDQIKFLHEILSNSKSLNDKYSKLFSQFRIDYNTDPPTWVISQDKVDPSDLSKVNFLKEIKILVEKEKNISHL